MITKCHFCDYSKSTPLSVNILKVLAKADMHIEDYALWFRRLIAEHSSSDWNGVKIHMGRMHKDLTYVDIWPEIDYEKDELKLIEAASKKFEKMGGKFVELVSSDVIIKHERLEPDKGFRWL